MLKKAITLIFIIIFISCSGLPKKLKAPKHEFRGVWIATVVNIDWPVSGKDPVEKKKKDFLKLLDFYKELNFNAAIVQVRTAGDAFYPSEYAPWSRFLTGKEGEANDEYIHLLHWMIEQTHKRGMEFHAWINPYRATFDLKTEVLSEQHDYFRHPEWMVKYGKKYYYNPGLPEVQEHLVNIITEIVEDYDIDAVHFDDYFYPYTLKNEVFEDAEAYHLYAKDSLSVEDWRRENINTLVKKSYHAIKAKKPWLQFGISPFGVWRNASTDALGSDTRAGQTTYDDLHADVLTWMKNGWVDYIAPQLYWSMDYPPASHKKLMEWWAKNSGETQLYIGNGPYKIRNNADKAWKKKKELPNQLKLARTTEKVNGNIFFSARSLNNNNNDIADYLKRKFYKYPAIPGMIEKQKSKENILRVASVFREKDQYVLKLDTIPDDARQLILYGFRSTKKINLNSGENILHIAYPDASNQITISEDFIKRKKVFAISYLNRYRKESEVFLFTLNIDNNGDLAIEKIRLNE